MSVLLGSILKLPNNNIFVRSERAFFVPCTFFFKKKQNRSYSHMLETSFSWNYVDLQEKSVFKKYLNEH